MKLHYISISLALLALTACQSGTPPGGVKIGKPYVIDGKTYYPGYDESYDKTGEASWYGPGFHGKYTANGEIFNQEDLTVAHPTLPMPSLVRVTNLENGKTAILRVNDRGPFKSNRIIDLSHASAQRLGVTSLAKVRVQYLKAETETYLASSNRQLDMFAYNDDANKLPPAVVQSSAIVESTVAMSGGGQTVTSAAPVLSVASSDTQPQQITDATHSREVHIDELPSISRLKPTLIRQAWAEDNVNQQPREPVRAEPVERVPPAFTESAPSAQGRDMRPVREYLPSAAEQPAATVHMVPAIEVTKEPSAKEPPTFGRESFIIRAGSYSSEDNARKLSNVAPSTVDRVEVRGKTMWRVRFGPYSTQAAAERDLPKIQKSGAADARVGKL